MSVIELVLVLTDGIANGFGTGNRDSCFKPLPELLYVAFFVERAESI